MSQIALESFGAYQKSRQLFDLVVTDMDTLKTNHFAIDLCHNKWTARIRSMQTSRKVTVD